MIKQEFWKKVAREWSTRDDGIVIPDIEPIDGDLGLDDDLKAWTDELDDILAEFDI